jgi:uncharacterized protein (TIGR02246 family)
MRPFRWLLVLCVLTLAPTILSASPDEDVGTVVNRWTRAFNANDVDALMKLYAPDANLIGTEDFDAIEGWDAIRAYFARLAKNGNKVALNNHQIVALDNNNAYVTGLYTFSFAQSGTTKKSREGFTLVLSKRGDAWLILHHHTAGCLIE